MCEMQHLPQDSLSHYRDNNSVQFPEIKKKKQKIKIILKTKIY